MTGVSNPFIHTPHERYFRRRESRAKIEDQSRSSKKIQEDRDGEDKGQEGICPAYSDEESDQSKAGSQEAKAYRENRLEGNQEVDPLHLNP